MKSEVKEVNKGYITLSGKVIVSDPCYDRDVWCNARDIAVKPGRYYVTVLAGDMQDFGQRNKCIIAIHCDDLHKPYANMELVSDKIGVDSGRCGIFDDTIYPLDKKSIGEHDDPNTFYGECCKLTRSDQRSGFLDNRKGVVSSSGIGDGVYELYCGYHKGDRVALLLNFERSVKLEDINSEAVRIISANKDIKNTAKNK